MPVADKRMDVDAGTENDKDRDRSQDKEKGGKGKSSGKAKDLSHVPCKFFKVGSCTAGASCPFSHSLHEPGQPKDVCAWFVKGNCKFGHKCALAHILPGQPMAMDRKNKKAAQLAANGNGGSQGKDRPKSMQKGAPNAPANGSGPGPGSSTRNTLLSGSTAPTRARPPMPVPLKATISPSAPAPPLRDTDFTSFGLPPNETKLPSVPAQRKLIEEDANAEPAAEKEPTNPSKNAPSPLPVSTPTAPRRLSAASPSDLGPIGSPTKSSSSTNRVNGFSPGTSPSKADFAPASPFSAPGTQSIFVKSEIHSHTTFRSGLAASLGATRTFGSPHDVGPHGISTEVVVEDEDLEEFIPGSLTDLLTPGERSRRMSRTASTSTPQTLAPHHRYSRSVPAASLLNDLKSIWGENGQVIGPALGVSPGLGNGSPSSFTSNQGFGGRISPSNASAAFLPGLHHHYKNAQKPGLGRAGPEWIGPSSLYSSNLPTAQVTGLPSAATDVGFTGAALSPPRFGARPPFDPAPTDPYLGQPDHLNDDGSFSPSARALQAHAPGQSLPQGLAAGYSRIHARPPPPPATSPNATAMDVLDSMMSRLSYSGAVGRSPGVGGAVPPGGMGNRSVSGRSTHVGPLSPLSGPVLTGDDDDLFSMDNMDA